MNGTRIDSASKSAFVRSTSGQTDRTEIISDTLVPTTIALVCGTVFVLSCLVVAYLLLRKAKTRLRSKRGREPELLSYCSTVDSYRAGIIRDFENRHHVREFLARVIDTGLRSTKGIFSSRRSSRSAPGGNNRRMTSSSATCPPSAASKGMRTTTAGNREASAGSSTRSSELLTSVSGASISGARPEASGPDARGRGTRRRGADPGTDDAAELIRARTCSGDPVYEEIDARLFRTASTSDGFYDRTASSNDYYWFGDGSGTPLDVSGSSLRATETASSSEAEVGRVGRLGDVPRTLNVISLSELSINIRSCPDSPLCGKEPPERRTPAIVHDTREGGPYPGDGLTTVCRDGRGCALSFSTTILDIVQGEARKRGLVDDSLVHQVIH